MAVADGQVGSCRGYHGFAAAHITLDQPVHRCTPLQVVADVPDGPGLGTGEGKGQGLVKAGKVTIIIRRGLLLGSFCPHKGKTGGKHKKFLKNQPPLGKLCFFHSSRFVDGIVGPVST